MQPRGPHDRRIELREPSFFHPLVKSFLLVAVIGAIGGGGYLVARSHLLDPGISGAGAKPLGQVAATARSYAAPRIRAHDDATPGSIQEQDQDQPSGPAAAAPSGTSVLVHTEYLAPQGRVLGASTAAPQSPGSALDRSIAALKGIADQLATTVQALHAELAGRQPVVISYSAAPSTPVSTQTFAAGQRIDNLSNTTITNPTITGGSITASSIVGTISSAISSALATIDDLTSNTITATNASFTNATTTTFYAGALSAGTASITNASTTDLATANLRVSSLNCAGYANGGTLTTDGSGNVVCATDDGTSRVGPAAIGLGRIQGLSVYPRFFASRRMLQ